MDKNEQTALVHAILHKNIVAVKLLVDRGAKIHNLHDGLSLRTALSFAAKYGTLEMLQYLITLLPEVRITCMFFLFSLALNNHIVSFICKLIKG